MACGPHCFGLPILFYVFINNKIVHFVDGIGTDDDKHYQSQCEEISVLSSHRLSGSQLVCDVTASHDPGSEETKTGRHGYPPTDSQSNNGTTNCHYYRAVSY